MKIFAYKIVFFFFEKFFPNFFSSVFIPASLWILLSLWLFCTTSLIFIFYLSSYRPLSLNTFFSLFLLQNHLSVSLTLLRYFSHFHFLSVFIPATVSFFLYLHTSHCVIIFENFCENFFENVFEKFLKKFCEFFFQNIFENSYANFFENFYENFFEFLF